MNSEKRGNIHSPENPNDENLWMSWENVCPNLSFTVENNIGN